MARRVLTMSGAAERLLASKLLLLKPSSDRRPNLALSILTGASGAQPAPEGDLPDEQVTHLPPYAPNRHGAQHFGRHTVYLSERQVGDVDRIAEACQRFGPRRISRSAVVRRAVEYLRAAVEADSDRAPWENN